MKISSRSGFTIIEVMLVLAISGSLLAIGFVGRGRIREQTQFTDGVERLASSLKRFQSEATSTVGRESNIPAICKGQIVGQNINCINLGILVDFADPNFSTDPNGPYDYSASQITADRKNDIAGTGFDARVRARNPQLVNQQIITPSWGISIKPDIGDADKKVAFIRHSGNGQVETIVMDSSTSVNSTSLDAAASANTEAKLNLYDADCNHAIITINPTGKPGDIKTEFMGKEPSC